MENVAVVKEKAKFHETAMASSQTQDWCTPPEVMDLVRKVGPIRLDVCTNAKNPTNADDYYTPAEDGLSKSWTTMFPGIAYCNPPYKTLKQWSAKAAEEWKRIDDLVIQTSIVMLIPARTDTKYWHADIFPTAAAVTFMKGRIKFIDPVTGKPQDAAPFPSALVYWGRNPDRFAKLMGEAGHHTVVL